MVKLARPTTQVRSLPATRSRVAQNPSTKYDLIKSISQPPRTEQVMAPTPLAPSPRTPARAITCEAASKPPIPSPVETTFHRRGMQINPATRRAHSATAAPPLTVHSHLPLSLAALTCCSHLLLTRATRRQPVTRTATPPASGRSRTTPLSVVGPPRAAEPRAWLGPGARKRSEHDGSPLDAQRRGHPQQHVLSILREHGAHAHAHAHTRP